jgi:hypothetical protein
MGDFAPFHFETAAPGTDRRTAAAYNALNLRPVSKCCGSAQMGGLDQPRRE